MPRECPTRLDTPRWQPRTVHVARRVALGFVRSQHRDRSAATLEKLQVQLDRFVHEYNQQRPHSQVTGEDVGGLVAMLRRLDQDIVEAWRPM
jgi:Integrase core domain